MRDGTGLAGDERRTRVLSCIKCMGFGGAERLLVSAAGARDTEQFDYELAYVLPSKRALVPEVEAAGVPVHCLGSSESDLDLRWMGRLRQLLMERRFDVVHFHLPYTAGLGRLVVRSLPRSSRPKTVTTEHNMWTTNPLALRALNSLTLPLDAAGLAVSDAVSEAMPPRHRRRVEVVIHGPSRSRLHQRESWRAEVRDELGVSPDEVLVGTVANLRPGKGYDVFLPAAAALIDLGLPARFVAVGAGPLEAEVDDLHRRLGLGDRFLLLGGRSDALRILAGFDVFVLASMSEGFPVSVMEALALGVPMVASAVGAIPDVVTPEVEALLVAPGCQDELVRALTLMIEDAPLRDRMAAAALIRGAEFDITSAVRRIEAIYQRVAQGTELSLTRQPPTTVVEAGGSGPGFDHPSRLAALSGRGEAL
ncbi:MAG: glycosyltransferase [Acidimicrobiales bacterium]